jgi:hypothetical protein
MFFYARDTSETVYCHRFYPSQTMKTNADGRLEFF